MKWPQRLRYHLSNAEGIVERSIEKQHPLYKRLNRRQKKQLHWRIYDFIRTTEFMIKFAGDHDKIKYTIAYAAAIISWKLSHKCYTRYHRVVVYEDEYHSTIAKQYHQGEVNPGAGIIVFSWGSVKKSLNVNNDGRNILYHEFAHALRLEHLMMDYNLFDEYDLTTYDEIAEKERKEMEIVEKHFFRRYATTNSEEFFAVAVENFFERPAEFRNRLPRLYFAISGLFKQNPLEFHQTHSLN